VEHRGIGVSDTYPIPVRHFGEVSVQHRRRGSRPRDGKNKNRTEKRVWGHNFDILEVTYGVLLEMASFFFLLILILGVGKHLVWGIKYVELLEMLTWIESSHPQSSLKNQTHNY
jgi:hypothetical protein